MRHRTPTSENFMFSQCKYHVLQIGMLNRDIDQIKLDGVIVQNSCKGSDNGTWSSRGSEKQGKGSWKEYTTLTLTRTAGGGRAYIPHVESRKFYSVKSRIYQDCHTP